MSNAFRATSDIIIRTEAWEAALHHYADVMGLKMIQHSEGMAGFDAGAFHLYVEKGSPHGPVLEFLVADVQQAKQALQAAGCTVMEEDASLPRCYVRDLYGVTFNLAQATAS